MTFDASGSSWLAIAASACATAMAGWLAVKSVGPGGLPGCGAGTGCGAVTRGRWSRLGPLPVATLGTGTYLVLLASAVLVAAGWRPPGLPLDHVAAATALTVVGAAAWFLAVQLFVIRRLCGYCMAAHALASLGAAVLLADVFPSVRSEWPAYAASAACGVAALAVGQVLLAPRTYAVTVVAAPAAVAPATPMVPAVDRPRPDGPGRPAGAARQVKLLGGSVVLSVTGWPLLGRPDAQHVIAALFDFTCQECHHLHRLLADAVRARPDWLAVAVVPVPLHPACNPAVTCRRAAAAQACDYARLAWSVWLAAPEAYVEWDGFVLAEELGQPYGLALIRGRELAGPGQFRAGGGDPLVDRAVATGVGLYQAAGRPAVPAVLLPAGLLRGYMPDLPALLRLLDAHLPQPRPAAAGTRPPGVR